MPTGTKYKPGSVLQYSSNDLNAKYYGQKVTCTKNSTTNIDLEFTDDMLIDGGRVIAKDVAFGDYVDCQVVDINGVLPGVPPGTVLKEFVTKWYLTPAESEGGFSVWDFTVPYPAKIFAGLFVRVKYHSVSESTDPEVAINYKRHLILE